MFTVSHVWAGPVWEGPQVVYSVHPVLNGVLGVWQLGGIMTLRSGFP
jgi:hypothetical protein